MFKAIAKTTDGVILFLGITAMNVTLLEDDQPIIFDLTTLEVPADVHVQKVILFYGKDEQAIFKVIESMMTPETKVHAVPRGPKSVS